MQNVFYDIGIILLAAMFLGFLAKLIKQPLIPAYIIAGILLTPVFGIITDIEVIRWLSEIGIAFLLFVVGLEIKFSRLKDVSSVVLYGGMMQFIFTSIFAFIVMSFVGFSNIEAAYLALVLVFSSTMVVVKLLADKKEIDTLHARITIGILLIQDIIAIFSLTFLSTLNQFNMILVSIAFLKAAVLLGLAYLMAKHLFPFVFEVAAKSQELLFLVSISICFIYSLLFQNIGNIFIFIMRDLLGMALGGTTLAYIEPGFSIAIGAFIAGISLANLPYNIEIIGKVTSIKDFFGILFFVSLGMQLVFINLHENILPLAVLLVFIILIKTIINLVICAMFGYTRTTSFYVALSLAQISEFSLIIVAQGRMYGHIDERIFTLTVLAAMISIALTSYFIKFDKVLYDKIGKHIGILDRMSSHKRKHLEYDMHLPGEEHKRVVLCGHDRVGFSILKMLKRLDKEVIVVDFNPDGIKELMSKRVPCIYGDLTDREIINRLEFKSASAVISTIPSLEVNSGILLEMRKYSKTTPVIVAANHIDEALQLYTLEADYVILPHFLGGEKVASMLEDIEKDKDALTFARTKHLDELKERKEKGQYHPEYHI